MIEIGTLCKINLSDIQYKIIDVRRKDVTIRLDKNTTHREIHFFVDLEEVENPQVKVIGVSTTNINSDEF
ncbi:hypothetical protein ACFQ3R_11335 [Mesonia ostreae]|uniref:Uncharacterized protein n=1 Tax=Mesonia ostreae TaxID=861110 RepID=A0ABU2KH02_9FLAO|nr:hypothetical protein [Mesonia ostreae]MDT0293974.1 hypothetical protein [Mesonia ostreae]